jgi:hypothetical protein
LRSSSANARNDQPQKVAGSEAECEETCTNAIIVRRVHSAQQAMVQLARSTGRLADELRPLDNDDRRPPRVVRPARPAARRRRRPDETSNRLDGRGPIGLAVATLVGRNDAIAGFGERHQLVSPGIPGLWKPCSSTTSGPVPYSTTCIRMPLVSTKRCRRSVMAVSPGSAR